MLSVVPGRAAGFLLRNEVVHLGLSGLHLGLGGGRVQTGLGFLDCRIGLGGEVLETRGIGGGGAHGLGVVVLRSGTRFFGRLELGLEF